MSSKNRLLSKLISNTGKVKEASLSATDIASTISKSSVTIDTFKDIDLTVQPEVLEIQVDDPTAGHTGTWLWTWLQSSLPYARATITNSPQLSVPLYKQGTIFCSVFQEG